MKYVNAEKTPEGNLRLVLLPEAREDLLDLRRAEESGEKSTGDIEAEVLEDLICNGFTHIRPEDVGALTSAPIISDDFATDRWGQTFVPPGGTVYAFMRYETRSIVDDLLEKGAATFTGAKVEQKERAT